MNDRYASGIAREVVVMRNRGESVSEIMRRLGVDRRFIDRAMTEQHKHQVSRETNIDYTGISQTGGY